MPAPVPAPAQDRRASLLEQIEALVEPAHEACDRLIVTQAARIQELERELHLLRRDLAVVEHSGPGPGTLTRRELEVLGLVAQGRSTEQMAQKLWIALPTVRNHLGKIFTKLDAHSRVEAVALARERGYLQ